MYRFYNPIPTHFKYYTISNYTLQLVSLLFVIENIICHQVVMCCSTVCPGKKSGAFPLQEQRTPLYWSLRLLGGLTERYLLMLMTMVSVVVTNAPKSESGLNCDECFGTISDSAEHLVKVAEFF